MLEWISPQSGEAQARRTIIPSDWNDWLGSSFQGSVEYCRNFGLPTGLKSDQKVWLVIESIDFRGSAILNDRQLGSHRLGDPPLRIEVQTMIRKSNVLKIEIEMPVEADRGPRTGLAGGLIGGVRLEIEEQE